MTRTAIVSGTLIDGTGRPPAPDMVVLIEGDRIIARFRRGERAVPADASIIDATGSFVLPGLIEGHGHVAVLASLANDGGQLLDSFMEQQITHGVTTIRDTGGPDLAEPFQNLTVGQPHWPRFFGSGPNLDGLPGGPWPGMWKTDDPDEAREMVRREAAGGVAFIKVYAWMKPDVLRAVTDQAHALGLIVAGHVGHATTVEQAVRYGLDALEHVRVGPELLSPDQTAELAALPYRYHDECASFRPWRFIDVAAGVCQDLIGLLAERAVVLTPTLYLTQRLLRPAMPAAAPSPAAPSTDVLRAGLEDEAIARDYTPEDFTWGEIEFARVLEFVGAAHRAGVPLVAGTDAPSADVLPGASLHGELELLVRCGLSPLEAITAATSEPARLLHQQHTLGTVENGKLADIILLSKDPTVDIRHSNSVHTVIKGGQLVWTSAPSRYPHASAALGRGPA
jgi:imidazolonepropionase-like amidohydrolase